MRCASLAVFRQQWLSGDVASPDLAENENEREQDCASVTTETVRICVTLSTIIQFITVRCH